MRGLRRILFMAHTMESTDDRRVSQDAAEGDPLELFLKADKLEREAKDLMREAVRLDADNEAGFEPMVFKDAVADGVVVEFAARGEKVPPDARAEAAAFSLATELAKSRAPTFLKRAAVFIASISSMLAIEAAMNEAQAQEGGFSWEKAVQVGQRAARGLERHMEYERQINDLRAEQGRLKSEYGTIMVQLGIETGTEFGAGKIENQAGYDADMLNLDAERDRVDADFAEIERPTKSDTLRHQARLKEIEAERLRIKARYGATGVRQSGRAEGETEELKRRRGELEARLAQIDNEIKVLRTRQLAEDAVDGIEAGREVER